MNLNAFKDFNSLYLQHSPNGSFLFNKLSRFLNWTPDQFVINNLDAVMFFRNLNDILLSDETNSDYLWTVFKVVNIAIENRSTHQYLVDTVRIITGVSNFALKVDPHETEDRYAQLWIFIDKITKGIVIQLEETHLIALIDYLVTNIKTAQLTEELKTLQVSILTNLCFKNKVAIACLLRFTKSKELLESISEMPILRCKLAIAIAHFQCSMLENEPEITLKYVFETECFATLIKAKHNLFLNHLLELLETSDEYSKNILQNFDFKESIDGILTYLDNSMETEEESETNDKDCSNHIDIFLGIVNAILSVSNGSLESNHQRLFNLALANVGTVDPSSVAIKTVRLIVSNSINLESENLIGLITRLVGNMDAHNLNPRVASEIYQLLSALYTKYPNIFTQLTQDIIKKSIDLGNFSLKLTDDSLAMQLHRLRWFLLYASQQEILLPQVLDAMKSKDVQHIFASGLNNPNEEICALTMTLIRSNYFPLESVSKLLSTEFRSNLQNSKRKFYSCNCESKPTHFSAPLEKRVKIAVDQMMEKVKGTNSSVERVELIDMIEYQSMFTSSKESLFQSQLKTSSDMITMQSNEIGCLKTIIRLHQDKISDLEKKEANRKETMDKMLSGYNSLKMKYDHITAELSDYTKQNNELKHDLKRVKELRKQMEQEKDELHAQNEKDRETHSAERAEQKKEFERKICDLTAQHEKVIKTCTSKLIEKQEREKKETENKHNKELESYSKKLLQQKKENEQKVSDLTTEVTHLKTELANVAKQNMKYEKEINEQNSSLSEKSSLLEKYESEIEEYKKKADLVMSMFTSKG